MTGRPLELDCRPPAPVSAAGRRAHVPGEPGLWVFLLGDMTMFSVFFGILLVARAGDPEGFAVGRRALHTGLGLVNTLLLLTGSLLVAAALHAMRDGRRGATLLLAVSLACAAGFAATKAVEYTLLVEAGHTPASGDFFMYYFVFTGIHLAHLVLGAALLVVMAVLSRRRTLSAGQVMAAECGASYWHMVDLLWLVLFALFYLVHT